MGTRVLREPTYETTRDANACLLMSYGQLLYIHGLLDRVDIKTMNALLGRIPYEVTHDSDIARLAFEAGFHEVSYSGANLEDLVNSFEAWKQAFADTGDDLDPDEDHRSAWIIWREFARGTLQLRKEFAEQHSVVPRYGTPDDLDRLIADGYSVITVVMNHNNGWAIYGLVHGGDSTDGYVVYHPVEGRMMCFANHLFPHGMAELTALGLPEGATGTPITLPA